MPKKIFIYEDMHSAYFSIPDLRELFSSTDIFPSKPDIYVGSYYFNTDGLVDPLFVIPGGTTYAMAKYVVPQMNGIRRQIGEKFDFLGICAGGFLATAEADLFTTKHKFDPYEVIHAPEYFSKLEESVDIPKGQPHNLNLFPDYRAIGAFYPNFSRFSVNTSKTFVPYRVTLDLPGTKRQLDQLYILGPAFVQNDTITEEKSEVIASYSGQAQVFEYPRPVGMKFFENPAAIIAKPATTTRGARLITGTHIETCVKGSKLLGSCEKDSDISIRLPEADYKRLIDQQEETQKEVVSLLRRTFNR